MVRHTLTALCALSLLSACAQLNTKTGSTAFGAALGCAVGATAAKLTSNDPRLACAAGALAGGALGYARARSAEVEEAQKATEAAASLPGATVSPVQTDSVQVRDKETRKTETVQAFKSVSVDIPLSQLNTPDGRAAIRKLEEYARRAADERGDTIDLTVANAPARGARPVKVALKETVEPAGKGKLRRIQLADPQVPANMQRISIEAKNPAQFEV